MPKRRHTKKRNALHDFLFPHKGNNYKPLLFTAGSLAVVLALVMLFEGAYLLQTRLVSRKTNYFASVLPSVLVDLTNKDREASGLAPLIYDPQLAQAAQHKADDMAEKGYFAHVSPEGKTPWYWLDQIGYKYTYAGENLAVNFDDSQDVENAWMASPTHHANIVKPQYTHVGFAVAKGMYEGRETTFVVQEFATPQGSVAAAPKAEPTKTNAVATAVTKAVQAVSPKPTTIEPSVAGATKTAEQDASKNVAIATAEKQTAETSQANTQVLGTETAQKAPDTAPAVKSPSFFARLVTAPNHTSTYVLGALALFFLALLLIAIFVHMSVQYVEVIGGGFLVVAVCLALLVFNAQSAPSVGIPSDGQSASVVQAL